MLRRTTPDMVFYQCYMHKKLGWLIQVGRPHGLVLQLVLFLLPSP